MSTPLLRPLRLDEWEQFRDIRLEALRRERAWYSSSYEREAAFGPSEWQDRLCDPDTCVFGFFDGDELAGITAVFRWRDDPSGATAILGASYVRPAFRGRGWSRLSFAARLRWAREHGRYTRCVVSHRASNTPSRRAIERAGFAEIARDAKPWHDGTVEDEILYELPLRSPPTPGLRAGRRESDERTAERWQSG